MTRLALRGCEPIAQPRIDLLQPAKQHGRHATNRAAAIAYAETMRETVAPLALAGETTRAIAQALNDRGLKPPRGGDWQATQIMRLLARLKLR
jgi:hypothetical protein